MFEQESLPANAAVQHPEEACWQAHLRQTLLPACAYEITKARYHDQARSAITDLNLAQQRERPGFPGVRICPAELSGDAYYTVRRLTLYDFEKNEKIKLRVQGEIRFCGEYQCRVSQEIRHYFFYNRPYESKMDRTCCYAFHDRAAGSEVLPGPAGGAKELLSVNEQLLNENRDLKNSLTLSNRTAEQIAGRKDMQHRRRQRSWTAGNISARTGNSTFH